MLTSGEDIVFQIFRPLFLRFRLFLLALIIFRGWRPAHGLFVLAHCVTSKERWKTMQACRMKGHRRAAASMGGGTGRMGSRWRWLCPISTTEGGLKMATGPPRINSIQGDALSSRQHDTFLTTPPPPPTPLVFPTPNLSSSHYWRCWINHLGT